MIDFEDYDHPAMREVDRDIITEAGIGAAEALTARGYWHGEFSPGDATRYEFLLAISQRTGGRYLVSSNFGNLHAWNGTPTIHPDYALSHFIADDSSWTAVVIALFLNATAAELERLTQPEGTTP